MLADPGFDKADGIGGCIDIIRILQSSFTTACSMQCSAISAVNVNSPFPVTIRSSFVIIKRASTVSCINMENPVTDIILSDLRFRAIP